MTGIVNIQTTYICNVSPGAFQIVRGAMFGGTSSTFRSYYPHVTFDYINTLNATTNGGGQVNAVQFFEATSGASDEIGFTALDSAFHPFTPKTGLYALSSFDLCLYPGGGSVVGLYYNWLTCIPTVSPA